MNFWNFITNELKLTLWRWSPIRTRPNPTRRGCWDDFNDSSNITIGFQKQKLWRFEVWMKKSRRNLARKTRQSRKSRQLRVRTLFCHASNMATTDSTRSGQNAHQKTIKSPLDSSFNVHDLIWRQINKSKWPTAFMGQRGKISKRNLNLLKGQPTFETVQSSLHI